MSDGPGQREASVAARTLSLLKGRADQVRSELAGLQRKLAGVQQDLSLRQAAELREANELLVLAALQAESIAEAAVGHLGELARSSQRDALTDTPNRALMLDRLETAIATSRRHGTRLAVVFLDVDHFKEINDTLGHGAGDEVLRLVARRLKSVIRESDSVSRHSGDEFLVLLSEISEDSDAAMIAGNMLSALAAPATVGGHEVHLSASLGIAIFPEDGEDAETLISRADTAMYRSKRRTPGSFRLFGEKTRDLHFPTAMVPGQRVTGQAFPARDEAPVRDLREANERLVIAALAAQSTEKAAEDVQLRHVRFLAMVAHELRGPLTPIKSAAGLLEHADVDDSLLGRAKELIESHVSQMSRLIDDLLDESRVSTGSFRLERSQLDLTEIINLSVETCRQAMDVRRQHFTMRVPGGPIIVDGDAVRLAQVFSNLLDNASRYTPLGGSIALDVTVLDKTTTITVSDNGIGITPDAVPVVFDLFPQTSGAPAEQGGGPGIGLAVVRQLVEAHGGTVVARSAGRHQGSEFVVTLPMDKKGDVV